MIEMQTSHVGHVDWRDADRALRTLAARRASLDAEEARWLLVARELRVHDRCGYGSFTEYCERVLGYRPHTTRERLRVAERLAELPAMAAALQEGELSFSVVRELTRMATSENEGQLIEAARGKTVREVEDLVAMHVPRPRVLRFEVTPEVEAKFRQVRRAIEHEVGERLDDSALLAILCERAMPAREVPVAGSSTIPRPVRRAVLRRDQHRCTVPGCRASAFLHFHHVIARASGGDDAPENLTLLCSAHHRAVHDGRLAITGRAPDQLRFVHDDGRPYGTEACDEARRALTRLGFAGPVARAAVARAASHVGRDVPMVDFVRACLRECPRPSG